MLVSGVNAAFVVGALLPGCPSWYDHSSLLTAAECGG